MLLLLAQYGIVFEDTRLTPNVKARYGDGTLIILVIVLFAAVLNFVRGTWNERVHWIRSSKHGVMPQATMGETAVARVVSQSDSQPRVPRLHVQSHSDVTLEL
jgi:hypothetical protein